jgi:hypothetical protein
MCNSNEPAGSTYYKARAAIQKVPFESYVDKITFMYKKPTVIGFVGGWRF